MKKYNHIELNKPLKFAKSKINNKQDWKGFPLSIHYIPRQDIHPLPISARVVMSC